MTTYVAILSGPAQAIDNYIDTASSRAEINVVSAKLELDRIAITAKTHVKEIHHFDGDTFFQHNAFRSPDAASDEDLEQKLQDGIFPPPVLQGAARHFQPSGLHRCLQCRGMNSYSYVLTLAKRRNWSSRAWRNLEFRSSTWACASI